MTAAPSRSSVGAARMAPAIWTSGEGTLAAAAIDAKRTTEASIFICVSPFRAPALVDLIASSIPYHSGERAAADSAADRRVVHRKPGEASGQLRFALSAIAGKLQGSFDLPLPRSPMHQ